MDQYVTEEDLHRVFDPFGGVLDVSIKESSVDVVSALLAISLHLLLT